ncbi:MAG: 16S rRNA (uracil(1498)-N(3))-methyltransferase [Betaproteobacteria bacterium]
MHKHLRPARAAGPKLQAALSRFFVPGNLSPGATHNLPDAAAHHAARVLRLTAGSQVVLFNGEGLEFAGEITRIGKDHVSVKLGPPRETSAESPLAVTLVQGVSARERMDYTLQKAVELGVAEIFPVETRRSVVRLAHERASRRVEHWQGVVVAACEQSGRTRVPKVNPITGLADWLGAHRAASDSLRVMLSPGADARLRDLAPSADITLLAGPEGGFEPEELEIAQSCKFTPVRLGPRILRTETAALAALAAMNCLWGDY